MKRKSNNSFSVALELPPEMKREIFGRLDEKGLRNAMSVCKIFKSQGEQVITEKNWLSKDLTEAFELKKDPIKLLMNLGNSHVMKDFVSMESNETKQTISSLYWLLFGLFLCSFEIIWSITNAFSKQPLENAFFVLLLSTLYLGYWISLSFRKLNNKSGKENYLFRGILTCLFSFYLAWSTGTTYTENVVGRKLTYILILTLVTLKTILITFIDSLITKTAQTTKIRSSITFEKRKSSTPLYLAVVPPVFYLLFFSQEFVLEMAFLIPVMLVHLFWVNHNLVCLRMVEFFRVLLSTSFVIMIVDFILSVVIRSASVTTNLYDFEKNGFLFYFASRIITAIFVGTFYNWIGLVHIFIERDVFTPFLSKKRSSKESSKLFMNAIFGFSLLTVALVVTETLC